MVEDPADSFHGIAGLFQRRVVNDEAAILALLPHALVSEYADETKQHVVHQPAPVHGRACQHPVVTVLARVKQFIEVLLVYGMNALAMDPEQAQGQYKLNGGNAVVLLKRQPAKKAAKAKTAKK